MAEQKPTDRLQAPVGSLIPVSQELLAHGRARWGKSPDQKSIGQSDQQEEFAAWFPALEPKGFHLEFAFLKREPETAPTGGPNTDFLLLRFVWLLGLCHTKDTY
jgi:hypothetical protein